MSVLTIFCPQNVLILATCSAAMKDADATSIYIWKDLDNRIPMPFTACRNSISVETYETLKFAILGLKCCHLPSSASSSPSNASYKCFLKFFPFF